MIHAHDSITDAIAELMPSVKFREWKPSHAMPAPGLPASNDLI